MVILSTSRTPTSQPFRSSILSQQRSWAEDGEKARAADYSSDSRPVDDWVPTPDAKRKKRNLVDHSDEEPVPTRQPPKWKPPNISEESKALRRKAVLDGLSQNTQPPTPESLSSSTRMTGQSRSRPATVTSQAAVATMSLSINGSGSSRPIDKAAVPALQRLPLPQESPQDLPSIPSTPRTSIRPNGVPSYDFDARNTGKMKQLNAPVMTRPPSRGVAHAAGAMTIEQKITLSEEQQKVLQLVVTEQKNIFFTGSAGTGKSVLLRELIKNLRRKYVRAPDAVAVTASTGIAACNIGGVTLNAFGGVGLGIEEAEVLARKIRSNKKAAARWVRTKVLIIDEISMVDGRLFDKLCKIGQILRKSTKPWGGIQLIVTGDFFQLPPVTKGSDSVSFCFDAATWPESINMSINLTKVFRQKDQRFVDMLNEMRFGRISGETVKAFAALRREILDDGRGIVPTELFPRREDVEKANKQRLERLPKDGWTYAAVDTGGTVTDPKQRAQLLSSYMAVPELELRKGAQVMLIKNLDESLVNGSMGTVIGFDYPQLFMLNAKGEWAPDEETLDTGLSEEDKAARELVRKNFTAKLDRTKTRPSPVVDFKIPGGSRRVMLVTPETFKTELPNGEVQVQRSQLPLILAWAMSIHKSQGQTLEKVKVDLSKVFEKGQAYVALSRATSLEGLQVLGFQSDKVMAHPKVTRWTAKLRDLNTSI